MNQFNVTIEEIKTIPNQKNLELTVRYPGGQIYIFEMERDEFLKLNCAVGATLVCESRDHLGGGWRGMAEIVDCNNPTGKGANDYLYTDCPFCHRKIDAHLQHCTDPHCSYNTAQRLNKIAAEYGYQLFGGVSGHDLCLKRGYNSLASVAIDVLKHSDEIPVGKKTLSHLKAFVKELRISTKNGFNWLNTCRIGKPVLKPIYWIFISQQIKDVQKLNCVSIEQFKEVIESLHPSAVENPPKEVLPDGAYAVTITSCSALKKQLINYYEVIRWELTNLSILQKLV